MRIMIVILAVGVWLICFQQREVYAQGSITLDHVNGAVGGDKLLAGPVVFYLRLTNGTGEPINGSSIGFRLYSTTGAQWLPKLYFDTGVGFIDTNFYGEWIDPAESELEWCCAGITSSMFGFVFTGTHADHDSNNNTPDVFGTGSDTIYFGGADGGLAAVGVPSGLSEIAWTISLEYVFHEDTGKTICLDSSSYRLGTQSLISGPGCLDSLAA